MTRDPLNDDGVRDVLRELGPDLTVAEWADKLDLRLSTVREVFRRLALDPSQATIARLEEEAADTRLRCVVARAGAGEHVTDRRIHIVKMLRSAGRPLTSREIYDALRPPYLVSRKTLGDDLAQLERLRGRTVRHVGYSSQTRWEAR